MKKEISSIELRHIISEMQLLDGARLDKISQSGNDFYFGFYVRAKGSFLIRVVPGKFIYLTKQKPEADEPGSFCLSLRKHLSNFFLKSISQVESERIARLDFEKGNDKFILFIELFGKGNIILCNRNLGIISLIEKQRWKDRTVAVGMRYECPKKDVNVFDMERKDVDVLKGSKTESAVKAIATDLGLGGVYAEEVCLLANINKNISPGKLAEVDLNAIHKAVKEILGKKPEPKAIIKDEKIVNIVPFDLEYYESNEFEKFDSYNEALDSVLAKVMAEGTEAEQGKAYKKEAEKINRIISQQEKTLEKARKMIEDNQRKGELIYENYALVKEVLDEMKKAKEKHSWQEIKAKLKGHKVIKSINEKEKKVLVEIP